MKELLVLILVLLLVSVALNVYQGMQAKEAQTQRLSENRANQETIAKATHRAEMAGARADSLQASFENRRRADSVALSGLKMRNKAMSENVQILREPVQPLIDSIAALGAFVAAQDSLVAGLKEENKQMELRHAAQIVDLTEALKERGNQVIAEAQKGEAWRQTAIQAQTDLTKEKRGKRFFQWTTGIAATVALYLSVR